MQSQGRPECLHVTAVTKSQYSSFLSWSAVISKQTSASNPIQIMTITTSKGSYDLPVDVLAAPRVADEKRSPTREFQRHSANTEREKKTKRTTPSEGRRGESNNWNRKGTSTDVTETTP
ncbi:hypothetical protein B0O99DRAFT_634454 [Bisporella sp. PMI_857]|nr:hypothetical protein B0O99DRAFT_634454 [Bisporella sp. PMI_857]